MTSAEITRRLKGRRIVSVKMNAFGTGRPGWNDYGRDPEITLYDSSLIRFAVEETGVGQYGVDLVVVKP